MWRASGLRPCTRNTTRAASRPLAPSGPQQRQFSLVKAGRPACRQIERALEFLRAVALGGEIASIGFLSSDNPGIDFFDLKRSGANLRNIAVGDRTALIELSRVMTMTGLKPVIDHAFDFTEARDAFVHLEGGNHLGKIVIRVGG